MQDTKYTYENLLLALNSMDEEKKRLLLESVKASDLLEMMNSKEKFGNVMKNVDQYVAWYQLMQSYLRELKMILNKPKCTSMKGINKETVSDDYDCLEEDEKKTVALNLINNPNFQKKYCEIMCCDIKRNINSDTTLKALDQLFGISNYMDKIIKAGIGCNHKYEGE